ncbi:eotaxin-like [Synchiropus splendidus]|uniref:eotaxin-like n=1 Tax=Synchiropus splendidus TaxID=270530 RepID=UPI00237DDC75|nr:eotaxin-like [Synchiropus splendidus]
MNLAPSTLLLLTSWMSCVLATHGPGNGNCCAAWSRPRRRFTQIQSYSIQSEGVCDFASVVFVALDGSKICADPKSAWSKKVMQNIDERVKLSTSSPATTVKALERLPASSWRSIRRSPRRRKGGRTSRRRQGK